MSACSVTKLQKAGTTNLDSFRVEAPFTMESDLIEIKAKVNGETRYMIFDTGADLSLITQDKATGKITEVEGAGNKSIKLGRDKVHSINIGELAFENTYAVNGKLQGVEQKMKNFGGIIGQPIIAKANWLFDFNEKVFIVSNQSLDQADFESINITRENGRPYATVTVEGTKYKAILDMGSTSTLSIPDNHPLAEILLQKLAFTKTKDQVFTITGLSEVTKQSATLPALQLANHHMTNLDVTILKSSQLRIGLNMFKNYDLLIDNDQQAYKIRKN